MNIYFSSFQKSRGGGDDPPRKIREGTRSPPPVPPPPPPGSPPMTITIGKYHNITAFRKNIYMYCKNAMCNYDWGKDTCLNNVLKVV